MEIDNLDDDKDRRERRWRCLHEDEPVFGLVPAEEAELAELDKEFGPWPKAEADG